MNIEGEKFQVIDTLNSPITVPDCFVKRDSKIGTGNGEAKLYIAPKTIMHTFFGTNQFAAKCFLLQSDLISYMNTLQYIYGDSGNSGSNASQFSPSPITLSSLSSVLNEISVILPDSNL